MKFLKTNNIFFGIVLAIFTPAISLSILLALNHGLEIWINEGKPLMKLNTLFMASIFLNLFIFFPYLKYDKYEKTGRGVLLITFLGVVILFLTMFN